MPCPICSAILPLNPESVAYVRVVDGNFLGSRVVELCACCVRRAESNPLAVRDSLRRVFAKGIN